jgi:hypothetical protein
MLKANASERVPVLAVLALGLTQIIGYGTLYLVFAVLNVAVCLPIQAWLSKPATAPRVATATAAVPVQGSLPPPTTGRCCC